MVVVTTVMMVVTVTMVMAVMAVMVVTVVAVVAVAQRARGDMVVTTVMMVTAVILVMAVMVAGRQDCTVGAPSPDCRPNPANDHGAGTTGWKKSPNAPQKNTKKHQKNTQKKYAPASPAASGTGRFVPTMTAVTEGLSLPACACRRET